MTVWGIADLHLSNARPDRRERYAARWREHAEQIAHHWRSTVRRRDLVLIPGDISMARNHRDLQPDLAWLDRLPGTKVFAPGNHDGWWNDVNKVRDMLRRSERAVDGDALQVGDAVICGALGAPVPEDTPTADQRRRVDRALASLDAALSAAAALRSPGMPLYLLWHYPPFDRNRQPGPWVDRFEASGVSACVYGHLHAEGQWSLAVQGEVRGVRYHCVAADAIGFRPLRLS